MAGVIGDDLLRRCRGLVGKTERIVLAKGLFIDQMIAVFSLSSLALIDDPISPRGCNLKTARGIFTIALSHQIRRECLRALGQHHVDKLLRGMERHDSRLSALGARHVGQTRSWLSKIKKTSPD